MANITKYPWGALGVGQSALVPFPASGELTTLRVSLLHFRRRALHAGLFTMDDGPHFAVERLPDGRTVRITRLEDGPLGALSGFENRVVTSAQRALEATLQDRIDAWHAAWHHAEDAGQPLPLPPLDLVEQLQASAPHLLHLIVDHHFRVLRNRKDITGLSAAEERELVAQTLARQARRTTDHEPRRRATDCGPHRRTTDAPHDGDAYHDARLCDKLSAACSKSHI